MPATRASQTPCRHRAFARRKRARRAVTSGRHVFGFTDHANDIARRSNRGHGDRVFANGPRGIEHLVTYIESLQVR